MADAGLRRPLALLGLWCSSCAGVTPAEVAAPTHGEAPHSAPRASPQDGQTEREPRGVFGRGFRVIYATGQGLEFPLPDAAGWRRDPRQKQSWVARHLVTSSTLVVRAWRHDDIARAEDCEEQARLWRPDLPAVANAELVETRQQTIANVYASQVTILVRAPRDGGALSGHALAFGSDARDCLMLAFSTSASGTGADAEIARRLGAVVESVFGRARRLGIDQRVPEPRL